MEHGVLRGRECWVHGPSDRRGGCLHSGTLSGGIVSRCDRRFRGMQGSLGGVLSGAMLDEQVLYKQGKFEKTR